MLFEKLPKFPPALPLDELRLLGGLPDAGTWECLEYRDWPIARRLERRGLVKTSMCDGDLWAEKKPAASLRQAK